MTYRIREVDGSDDDIADILRRLNDATEFPRLSESALDYGHWWIAYLDGEPVAFAGMVASSQWMDVGYMNRAGVLPGHRGCGLQRRLMRVRELKARRIGWTCLVSDCTDNVHSANNFIRSGFRMYEPRRPWAFGHSLYWRKDL